MARSNPISIATALATRFSLLQPNAKNQRSRKSISDFEVPVVTDVRGAHDNRNRLSSGEQPPAMDLGCGLFHAMGGSAMICRTCTVTMRILLAIAGAWMTSTFLASVCMDAPVYQQKFKNPARLVPLNLWMSTHSSDALLKRTACFVSQDDHVGQPDRSRWTLVWEDSLLLFVKRRNRKSLRPAKRKKKSSGRRVRQPPLSTQHSAASRSPN
ncbi:hypothetical protein BKA81DRAFT_132164 [Phyllosticta paracitricarpa]|uniref:Uncharacterized protein n=1 Tax=Phyllosticta paracitricarpa TaxID=2016321 RepID=A0ABR1MVM4_9PEZI